MGGCQVYLGTLIPGSVPVDFLIGPIVELLPEGQGEGLNFPPESPAVQKGHRKVHLAAVAPHAP